MRSERLYIHAPSVAMHQAVRDVFGGVDDVTVVHTPAQIALPIDAMVIHCIDSQWLHAHLHHHFAHVLGLHVTPALLSALAEAFGGHRPHGQPATQLIAVPLGPHLVCAPVDRHGLARLGAQEAFYRAHHAALQGAMRQGLSRLLNVLPAAPRFGRPDEIALGLHRAWAARFTPLTHSLASAFGATMSSPSTTGDGRDHLPSPSAAATDAGIAGAVPAIRPP